MARKRQDDDESTTNDGDAKPKNTMIIALIAGGAVLLCCTCGGVGTGGWFLRDKLGFGSAQGKKDDGANKDQVAKEGGNDGNKDDKKPPEKQPPVENRKPDIVTTAEAFYTEFDDKDNAPARAKYAGKIVELTGEVQSVGDKKMIFLVGDKRLNDKLGGKGIGMRNVSCDVLADYQDLSINLARGQKVKVVGKFLKAAVFQIQLAECSVTPLEQANVPRVSVEDMAREYEKNSKAAKTKYDFMDVIFTGVVDRIVMAPDDSGYVHMKAATKMRVKLIGFPNDIRQISAGRQIEFRPMPGVTGILKGEVVITMKSLVNVK